MLKTLPSKSSMLFSNLVTDLSANSARVSACNDLIHLSQGHGDSNQQLRVQGKPEDRPQVFITRRVATVSDGSQLTRYIENLSICLTWTVRLERTVPWPTPQNLNHPPSRQPLPGSRITSFSLSERTLISSSYLSSFCEYCNQKERSRCQAAALTLMPSHTRDVPAQSTDVGDPLAGNRTSGITWHTTIHSLLSCLLLYMG